MTKASSLYPPKGYIRNKVDCIRSCGGTDW